MENRMIKDKKMIKRDILDKFRSIIEESDRLPPKWLETDYFVNLNQHEKKIFKKAINELISRGIVEDVNGSSQNLKLTQKGADLIY
jgi:predicted transcriptional regulator